MKLFNRKGEEAETGGMGDVVHIIVVLALVALVFFVPGRIYAAIAGTGDRDTMGSFNAIADNIEIMVSKPTAFEYQYLTVYVAQSSMITAFADSSTFRSYSGVFPDEVNYFYPEKCEQKSCLCIYSFKTNQYTDENLFKNFPWNPNKCRTFESNIIFHTYNPAGTGIYAADPDSRRSVMPFRKIRSQVSSLYDDYPTELSLDYTDLIIGQFNKEGFYNLYMEKLVKDGRTHIFITSGLTDEQVEERVSLLSVCPQASDRDCVGKRQNARVGSSFCYFSITERRCILKDDVQDCPTEQKLTSNCVCGSSFFSTATSMGSGYCHEGSDGKLALLNYDCNSLSREGDPCKSYCSSNTKTSNAEGLNDCDPQEQKDCLADTCQLNGNEGCTISPKGSLAYCEHN
jgi:hypothetical protein